MNLIDAMARSESTTDLNTLLQASGSLFDESDGAVSEVPVQFVGADDARVPRAPESIKETARCAHAG